MTEFISAKKVCNLLHTNHNSVQWVEQNVSLTSKKMANDNKFGFLQSKSDLVLLIQHATRYARQRTETQNSKHWQNEFSNFIQMGMLT